MSLDTNRTIFADRPAAVPAVGLRGIVIIERNPDLRLSLFDALADAQSGMEVLATGASDDDALNIVAAHMPDVLVLGSTLAYSTAETLGSRLREIAPSLRVILLAPWNGPIPDTHIDAMMRGHLHVVFTTDSRGESRGAHVCDDVVRGVRALTHWLAPAGGNDADLPALDGSGLDLVCVGGGAVGMATLGAMLRGAPRNLKCPLLFAHDMPAAMAEGFAVWFARRGMQASVARHGDELRPGVLHLLTGEAQAYVNRSRHGTLRVSLLPLAADESQTLLDPLLNSVARVAGERSLSLLLGLLGQDGWEGADALVTCDGHVFMQDINDVHGDAARRASASARLAGRTVSIDAIAMAITKAGLVA